MVDIKNKEIIAQSIEIPVLKESFLAKGAELVQQNITR